MRLTPDLLLDDVSEAEWLVRAIDTPWRDGVFVHHHVPRGYRFYVRLFHPAYAADGAPIRWSDVALATGKAAHAQMQWEAIGGQREGLWDREPEQGRVPAEQLAALNDVLRRPGPSPCRFLFWEGFGGMHPPASAPRIRTHARAYVLYAADLDVGTVLEDEHGWTRSPSIWWPQDRRWVAANDVDLTTTFLALQDEAEVAAMARHPDLEVALIDVDAQTDAAGDALNRP